MYNRHKAACLVTGVTNIQHVRNGTVSTGTQAVCINPTGTDLSNITHLVISYDCTCSKTLEQLIKSLTLKILVY